MRARLAWTVALPLAAAATWAAHVLDYRLVVPNASARDALLAATGHGYADWVPLGISVLGAAGVAGLIVSAGELRARALRPLTWPFLVLPPLTFALQEHLERWVATGHAPWGAALEPTFLPGLALTIPFGLAAYAVARALLRAARRIALAFAPQRVLVRCAPPVARAVATVFVPAAVLASGHRTRGPPRVR